MTFLQQAIFLEEAVVDKDGFIHEMFQYGQDIYEFVYTRETRSTTDDGGEDIRDFFHYQLYKYKDAEQPANS